MGQCLLQLSRLEDAFQQFLVAQQIDPYLRSAYYGAFQAAQRLRKTEEATQQLEQFQKLESNPQARLAEIKYSRMGPKAEASPLEFEPQEPVVRPEGALFTDARPLPIHGDEGIDWRSDESNTSPPSLTVCDIDGDGLLDLFAASALVNENSTWNAVLMRRDDRFELERDHPLAEIEHVNAAIWGDYDNDGLTDVYLCRRGANQLWKQISQNEWENVTGSTGTSNGMSNTVDGVFVDADHDGDLDILLANEDAPNELLNNNLDGTFRELGQSQGIAGDGRPTRQIVVADLDSDRDVDLLFIKQEPPHDVYLNNRLWSYEPASGFDAFRQAPIISALAVDSQDDSEPEEDVTVGDWSAIETAAAASGADGQIELITRLPEGGIRWAPRADGTWNPRALEHGAGGAGQAGPMAIQDVDGDGKLDLVFSSGEQWKVMNLQGASSMTFESSAPRLGHWALVMLDEQRGPSLVALRSGEPPCQWSPGPGRFQFAGLSFTGKEDKAEQMRSNASGIGVQFHVNLVGQTTAFNTFRHHSGPGQSLQPIAVGLGQSGYIASVKITWPDGVFQTELDLAAGKPHRIVETQRQISSCPVVFAWNGEKYEFVTDVLGVGGIGFNVGAGEYPPPRPWENLLLPQNLLVARNGVFEIKIAEPMEEACYLDAARLVAYDLPPAWQMTLDERFAVEGPPPTGEPVFYRQSSVPRSVANDRGHDVTEHVVAADLHAAEPGEIDRRFVGRTKEHVLTMTFDQPLTRTRGQPLLICSGWIEYPYSQTMFSAWQAGATYDAPTVEAQAADGQWYVVIEQFGYMAGMPREMSVPLPADRLPRGTKRLRLRSNMEIYWDQVNVAYAEDGANVSRRELPLQSASVAETGFAARPQLPQRLPYYDYDRRLPLWDTRHQAGFYTRFGAADPLVRRTDDAVAIIGPGEEVHLSFSAGLPELPDGWTRRFVLETNGWCKDSDLYTKDGEQLEPLPLREEGKPEGDKLRRALHAKHNTRYRSGS